MNNILLNNNEYFKIYSNLLFVTIILILSEIGLGISFGEFEMYKILDYILIFLIFISILKNPINMTKYIGNSLKNQLNGYKFLIFLIIIHLTYGLISFKYTKNISIGILKYEPILYILIMIFMYLLYLNKLEDNSDFKINYLLVFLGLPFVVVTIYTWIYFFIYKQTYYGRRLSLIKDYNDFGIFLLFSFVCLVYLIFRKIENIKIRNLILYFLITVGYSTIHLTSSRRSYRMLNIIVILFFLYSLYEILSKNIVKKKINKKTIIKLFGNIFILLLTTGLVIVSCKFIIFSYNYTTEKYNSKLTENKYGNGIKINRDVELILKDPEAFGKREFLWKMAIDTYFNYTNKEKIIGKGASAQVDIYNEPENKAKRDKEYGVVIADNTSHPHNFLLTELLNGGIILLSITLMILITVLILLIKILKKSPVDSCFIFILSSITFGDLFVDGRHGLLGSPYFWISLIVLISVNNSNLKENLVK